MADLIAFLKARLDEDEVAAKASAAHSGSASWDLRPDDPYEEFPAKVALAGAAYPFPWVVACDPEDGAHIARHDPARVLREVEAKRALVGWHVPLEDCEPPQCVVCLEYMPCRTLRALAAAYSDHPDFDQERKP